MQHREYKEQVAVFEWAKAQSGKHPLLKLLHAPAPIGVKLTELQAARAKAAGYTAGMPDLFLPCPRVKMYEEMTRDELNNLDNDVIWYHGLFIELKAPANKIQRLAPGKISIKQQNILIKLNELGYYATVSYGWEQARDTIKWYLGI